MNSKIKEIFKSSSVYGISIIFSTLVPFFTIPIILKNLTVAEYGELGRIQSLLATIISFAGLNIASSNYRFQKHGATKYKNSYNTTLLWSSNYLVLISVFVVSFLSFFFLENTYKIIGILYIFIQSIYTYLISLLRTKNKTKIYAIFQITKSLIYILLFLFLSYANKLSVLTILSVYIIADFSFSIILLKYLFNNKLIGLRFSTIFMKRTLLYSLPVLPAYLFQTYLQQSPLLMLNFSNEYLGIINLSNKISLIVFGLQSVISLTWPYFAFKYQEENIHQAVFSHLAMLLILCNWFIFFSYDLIINTIANYEFLGAKFITIGFIGSYSISVLGNFMDNSANISNKTYLIAIVFLIGSSMAFILYRMIDNIFLYKFPFFPLLIGFICMLVIRIVIYSKNKFFKSWNNNIIIFYMFNLLTILILSY